MTVYEQYIFNKEKYLLLITFSNIAYDLTVGQPDFSVPKCLKEENKRVVDDDKKAGA